jgi:PII-like signaling protein
MEHGTRVRIYFDEGDHVDGQPLWRVLLDILRQEGARGAVVVRGLAGFGAHRQIHTPHVVDVKSELPLIVEWIDTDEQVAGLLPRIEALLRGNGGLVTREPVEMERYGGEKTAG